MVKLTDIAHLLRMAAVFLLGLFVFLVLRSAFLPKTFGQYGHYRGEALAEITARRVAYAGHQACEMCHSDVAEAKLKGVHAHVNCESCHGPLGKHSDDPASESPSKIDIAHLCVRCHSENPAKPQSFPQVNAKEHSGGQACDTCHQPHSPGFDAGGKK